MPKIKSPTPQELYRAKKQREEQEKIAYLPPGLVNHGNTCFMNSVLQGLIATKLLSDLVHFEPISDQVQKHSNTLIASRRSPQLTNGHGLAGPYEQQWIDSMPLGDIFLSVIHRAWQAQKLKRRESLSPKPILGILGRKYDQYLDFAQQDAHEFLRILLDAMRMEELDVIKERQPPVRQRSRRHRTTTTPSSFPPSADPTSFSLDSVHEEEKLTSMVDMIFGGSLTSILVCQKCKHVSQTYEDFNDLSLSIKAEDYVRERKRDRLKTLAKKLASFNTSPNSLTTSFSVPRASSVPPTPHPREEVQFGESDPPIEPRRRSFDVPDHERREEGIRINGPTIPAEEHGVELKPEKDKGKEKNKDWAKLGRRISASVGFAKPSKEKDRNSRPRDTEAISDSLASSLNSTPRVSTSDDLPHQSTSLERLRPDDFPKRPKPLRLPQPSSSSSVTSISSSTSFSHVSRSKSPKPPKATPAETAYLRRILADISPSPSLNPFAFFQNGTNPSVSASHSTPQTWLKPVGKVTGVEECLRLFTAVEVLDNENRVGCRHCWKLEHGVSEPSPSPKNDDNEDEDDSDLDGEFSGDASLSAATASLQAVSLPTSLSTPSISMYSHSNLSDGSLASLPTVATSVSDSGINSKAIPSLTVMTTVSSQEKGTTFSNPGGLPIPFISTAPPSPDDTILQPLTARPHGYFPILNTVPSSSANDTGSSSADTSMSDTRISSTPQLHDSETNPLLAAPRSSRRPKAHVDSADESSDESDVSVSASLHSTDSSSQINGNHPVASTSKPKLRKKPKPVIMRPAYKRYLIATPPPVLVIHLKRFQQISKSVISFSSGFKKLDDYVAFPEYLDLTPFLAPRKEDFDLGSGETKVKPRSKEVERCMYRLYAVVVHMGSMLGGHYFAYTALPQPPEPTPESSLADQPNASPKAERQWAYISDTVVRLTTKEEVLKAKAYLCMYERM